MIDEKQLLILANDPEAIKSMKSVMKSAGRFTEAKWKAITARLLLARLGNADD